MDGRLTRYQLEMLQLIQKGNPDREEGGCIDFDQLLDRLSWEPTKASCHFSIRALVRRGLIQKTPELLLRRGRQRVGFVLTQAGRLALDPRDSVSSSPSMDLENPSGELDDLILEVSEGV